MNNPKIMIVEDNEDIRKMMRQILTGEGCDVLEAASGAEAIRLLEDNKPNLILIELILSDVSGVELGNKVRSVPNGSAATLILIAGFLGKYDESQVIENGFTTVLIKPIERESLLLAVKANLPNTKHDLQFSSKSKILIADDNPMQLKLLAYQLESVGFDVATARDGREALDKIIEVKPDAVISDIMMPEIDGFDFCMQCRLQPQVSDIPIILLSNSYVEETDKKLAMQAGANAHLMRTHDPQPIIDVLNKILLNRWHETTTISESKFNDEHINRLLHQLDKQSTSLRDMERLYALKNAQIMLLNEIMTSLKKSSDVDRVLDKMLSFSLDAAGVAKGIIYLLDSNDTLSRLFSYGYSDTDSGDLDDFFGNLETLTGLLDKNRIVELPSRNISETITNDILHRSRTVSAVVVPLGGANGLCGVLFLGYLTSNFTKDDISFAHHLGTNIMQAVSLASSFRSLYFVESKYKTLQNLVDDGMLIHDARGVILEANTCIEKIFNTRRNEILGRDIKDFIDVDYQQKFSDLLLRSKNGDNDARFECRLKSNADYLCQVNIAVIDGASNGEIVYMAVISMHDRT